MKNKLIIWNYLIDLMENTPLMKEGPIEIVESNDNYFKVWFVINGNIISFNIKIEYSFFKDTEIIIDDIKFINVLVQRVVLNHKEEGKRNLVRESDLIRLILPLIRNNKLERVGI